MEPREPVAESEGVFHTSWTFMAAPGAVIVLRFSGHDTCLGVTWTLADTMCGGPSVVNPMWDCRNCAKSAPMT